MPTDASNESTMPEDEPESEDVDKVAVSRYAEQHGPAAAAKRYGVKLGSAKGWLARYRAGAYGPPDTLAVSAKHREGVSAVSDGEEGTGGASVATVKRVARATARNQPELAALRREFTGLADLMRKARRGNGEPLEKVKVLTAALEKLERAGRVPFGYGPDSGGQRQSLINVSIHNARGSDLPVMDVAAEVVRELPAQDEGQSSTSA